MKTKPFFFLLVVLLSTMVLITPSGLAQQVISSHALDNKTVSEPKAVEADFITVREYLVFLRANTSQKNADELYYDALENQIVRTSEEGQDGYEIAPGVNDNDLMLGLTSSEMKAYFNWTGTSVEAKVSPLMMFGGDIEEPEKKSEPNIGSHSEDSRVTQPTTGTSVATTERGTGLLSVKGDTDETPSSSAASSHLALEALPSATFVRDRSVFGEPLALDFFSDKKMAKGSSRVALPEAGANHSEIKDKEDRKVEAYVALMAAQDLWLHGKELKDAALRKWQQSDEALKKAAILVPRDELEHLQGDGWRATSDSISQEGKDYVALRGQSEALHQKYDDYVEQTKFPENNKAAFDQANNNYLTITRELDAARQPLASSVSENPATSGREMRSSSRPRTDTSSSSSTGSDQSSTLTSHDGFLKSDSLDSSPSSSFGKKSPGGSPEGSPGGVGDVIVESLHLERERIQKEIDKYKKHIGFCSTSWRIDNIDEKQQRLITGWYKYLSFVRERHDLRKRIIAASSSEAYFPSEESQQALRLTQQQYEDALQERDQCKSQADQFLQLFNTHHQNVLEKSRPLTAFLNENPFTAWGLRFGFTTHSLRLLEEKERLETAHNDALRAKNRFIFETSKQFGNAKAALAQAEERVVKLATLHAKQLNNLLISPDQQLLNEEVPYFNTLIQRRADYNKALEESVSDFKEDCENLYKVQYAYERHGENSLEARQEEKLDMQRTKKGISIQIRLEESKFALLAPEERALDLEETTKSLADLKQRLLWPDEKFLKNIKQGTLQCMERARARTAESQQMCIDWCIEEGITPPNFSISSSSSRSAGYSGLSLGTQNAMQRSWQQSQQTQFYSQQAANAQWNYNMNQSIQGMQPRW